MKSNIHKITVIGDGGWGTTLAVHLQKKNYHVTLWGPFPEYIKEIESTRINSKFLPGITIPKEIILTSDLASALKGSELIVFAIPSKYAIDVIKKIKLADVDLSKKIILSVTKGIDTEKLLRISELIQKELKKVPFAVLSGPTIASEVAREIPSTAVIAAKDARLAKKIQTIFNSDYFRIYTNTDIIGVEVGGSLKNVIAIACGVCDGLGFGTNTKSAIMTRGLKEMTTLGLKLGAKKETFYGLTGLGDLITTCTNTNSRNRTVGEALGKGQSIDNILNSMSMVAEGVETVKAAYRLGKKYKSPMPITDEVYNIIYKNKSPKDAVKNLMTRQMRSE